MVKVDYERRWQQLKVWLAAEMETSKDMILMFPQLSSDELLRQHTRIHTLADMKVELKHDGYELKSVKPDKIYYAPDPAPHRKEVRTVAAFNPTVVTELVPSGNRAGRNGRNG